MTKPQSIHVSRPPLSLISDSWAWVMPSFALTDLARGWCTVSGNAIILVSYCYVVALGLRQRECEEGPLDCIGSCVILGSLQDHQSSTRGRSKHSYVSHCHFITQFSASDAECWDMTKSEWDSPQCNSKFQNPSHPHCYCMMTDMTQHFFGWCGVPQRYLDMVICVCSGPRTSTQLRILYWGIKTDT